MASLARAAPRQVLGAMQLTLRFLRRPLYLPGLLLLSPLLLLHIPEVVLPRRTHHTLVKLGGGDKPDNQQTVLLILSTLGTGEAEEAVGGSQAVMSRLDRVNLAQCKSHRRRRQIQGLVRKMREAQTRR